MAWRFPATRNHSRTGSLQILVLLSFVTVIATSFDPAEALEKLKSVGAELAWPSFEKNTSLVEYAFSKQESFETPAGGLADNIKVVSMSPYVLVIDDFLSSRECDFLRAFGANRLKPAMVVQSAGNWYDTQAQTRNNDQIWLTQTEERHTPLLRHIMKRIHRTARVPDEFAEALQIGRYKVGTKYEGHIDTDPGHNVGRPATFITYLNDVEEGGHTLFPLGRNDCDAIWRKDPKTGEQVYGAKLCCDSPELDAPETIRVVPKKGRAALFFSHRPDGSVDGGSTHIGCPVNKGEKWIAQRWLRYEPYNRVDYAMEGWDPRFDGIPIKQYRVGSRKEVHLRSLSQNRPKAYLEEHFLDTIEVMALHTIIVKALNPGGASVAQPPGKERPNSVTLQKAELDADPVLKNLTDRVFVFARIPPQQDVSLEFRRLNIEEFAKVEIELNPPAIKVYMYLPSNLDSLDEDMTRGGELILPAADKYYSEGESPQEKVDACNKNIVDCCKKAAFKVDVHKGDAVLLYLFGQDGRLDPHSSHGHCKLQRGETWIAEWRIWYKQQAQDQPASKTSDQQPSVKFENQSKDQVQIFWLPPGGGKEQFMGDVPAGDTKALNSYPGHEFMIRRMDGSLADKFHVGSTVVQRFIVTDTQEL